MSYGKWQKTPDDLEEEATSGLGGLYQMLWSQFGGRPYSYMIADTLHKYPLLWLLGTVIVGSILGHLFW